MKKKIASLFLALALCAGLCVPASAAATSKPYITQVEAGMNLSLAVTSDGDLYGWGINHGSYGYGGNIAQVFGSENGSYVNAPVKIMSDVKAVAASAANKAAGPSIYVTVNDSSYTAISYTIIPANVFLIIKENGDLYAWGDNIVGQLGQGYSTKQESYAPIFVMSDVVKAATNDHSCAAVTESGDLYFWGYNVDSGHGSGDAVFYRSPTKLMTDVKDVEMSNDNVFVLKNDGSVWGMGSTYHGVLGIQPSTDTDHYLVKEMTKIMDGCIDIATGRDFAMAVKSDGRLFAWGENNMAQLGLYWDTTPYTATPTQIATNVRSVDAGDRNAYFIKNDNSLWVTGDNWAGMRGGGDDTRYYDPISKSMKEYPYYPTQIDTDVRSVSSGIRHMLYLKNDGTMWGCGFDNVQCHNLGRGDVYGSYNKDNKDDHYSYCYWPAQCGLSYGAYAGKFGAFFRDVTDSAYFYDPVTWAVDEGITNGTTATTFSPYATCTRAQIITYLYRAAGSPSVSISNPFADVSESVYYYDAARWAYSQGMVEGDTFAPDDPCTRAMAVEFMWKQAGSPSARGASFTDVSSGASYASAVAWAVAEGITTGATATTFAPDTTCTRGQIVTFLYRGNK